MLNLKKIDKITYKQIDIMKHTIGFNRGRIRGTKYRRYAPYRNYFDAGPADIASIESLVEIGLMKEYRKNWFAVTDDGREFLELVTGVNILEEQNQRHANPAHCHDTAGCWCSSGLFVA